MCEAGSEVLHAAGLRKWSVIVILEDIEPFPLRSTAAMTMVVARAISIIVVLGAAKDWKPRSSGLPSAASSIDIEVGERRTPAYR
jgi:hypothetical protein